MDVSTKVKQDYRDNSIMKYIKLSFPELNMVITNDQIYTESLKLTESLCESSNIEFVGCISSCFSIKVNNLKQDIKGKKIIVQIYTENTENEPVKLFEGYIDSAVRDSNKRSKEITAYDVLYTKGNTDVADWYKDLSFPITLKDLRDSLFNYLGIAQEVTELPNDDVTISKQFDPKTLQALPVIKSICQINGAFGIINRDGKFEYRILKRNIVIPPYPAMNLYPAKFMYPATSSGEFVVPENFSFYRSIDFEEYSVRPIDKITIRQSEDDKTAVTVGNGTNNYIIQNNIFTEGLSTDVKTEVATNIYECVGGFSFIPFNSSNNGLPWLECGIDAVAYQVYNYDYVESADGISLMSDDDNSEFKQQTFYILNRELSGIQALKDTYTAEGEEYQSEFITDLQTQLDTIRQNGVNMEDYYTKEEVDFQIENMEQPTNFKIVSCYKLPGNMENNTLYCVRGLVTIQ